MSVSIKAELQDLKKTLILDEASKLFEEIGYEHMKVADLAKTVSVSIGTIYGMFDSKEGLYMAYIEHQINTFTMELEKRTTAQDSAEKRLKLFIELKFSYYTQKYIALDHSVKNNPFFFNTLYKDNFHPLQNIFLFQAECFKEINKGIDDDDAMQLAYLFNSFSDGYVSRWFEIRYDLMSKVDEASRLFSVMVKGKSV
jgi:AcrR family transcriptional regulator